MKSAPFGPLDPALYRELVRRALAEDLGWGDVTTEATVPRDVQGRGVITTRTRCVVAGLDIAAEVFRQMDPGVVFSSTVSDGTWCEPRAELATVEGRASSLVTAERTALNFLQRLSGIATLTRRFVEAADDRLVVLDTRKTTPTLRAIEKYAVRAGGGTNHRFALDDAILVKDNHIALAGGLAAAIERLKKAAQDLPIQVEVTTLEELDVALAAGVPRILADNMTLDELREVVRRTRGRAQVEVSGGVTLERVDELAQVGADFVSVGALTHSAPAIDLSLSLEPA
jgi:nicotinate-nucleotide pyrophosphorylase (carboxylating)